MEDVARPPARTEAPLGFSLPALLLTLVVCLGLVLVALLFVDRTTKIPPTPPPSPRLKTSLDAAGRTLTHDLKAAASGLLPAAEAVRLLSDNLAESRLFTDVFGQPTLVRPGTDILGLRGVLRSPSLRLDAAEGSGDIQRRPEAARLRIFGSNGRQSQALQETAARLRARLLAGRAKHFFIVTDGAGAWAVARVMAFDASRLTGCEASGGSAGGGACDLEVTLDFTDSDAAGQNRGGEVAAPSRLGPLVAGGLYDDLAFFVAVGPGGRPPDYLVVTDPRSMANPHPFLAAAEAAGSGRWEIVRVAEEIENLQVAFGLVGADGTETWIGDRPGSPALAPEGRGQALRERIAAVRCALVAVGPRRTGPEREDLALALPFNAPPPDVNVSPIGWSPLPRGRVALERESRLLEVRFPSSR